MTTAMTSYTLLILVIIVTFVSINTYEFYPAGIYDKALDPYRLLTPGVLFSLYLVFVLRKNRSFWKLALFGFILFVMYCASLVTGMSSWGIAVPFAGGVGALLIKKLFYNQAELLDTNGKRYLSIGFIAGFIGIGLFYLIINRWKVGVGFAAILILWQLAIGIVLIKQAGNSTPKA